jgi:outer membrane lipoprotein SlyB
VGKPTGTGGAQGETVGGRRGNRWRRGWHPALSQREGAVAVGRGSRSQSLARQTVSTAVKLDDMEARGYVGRDRRALSGEEMLASAPSAARR